MPGRPNDQDEKSSVARPHQMYRRIVIGALTALARDDLDAPGRHTGGASDGL